MVKISSNLVTICLHNGFASDRYWRHQPSKQRFVRINISPNPRDFSFYFSKSFTFLLTHSLFYNAPNVFDRPYNRKFRTLLKSVLIRVRRFLPLLVEPKFNNIHFAKPTRLCLSFSVNFCVLYLWYGLDPALFKPLQTVIWLTPVSRATARTTRFS